ncbi:hypothetical protein AC578_11133 [Pseudocercospora eumusae]|uniref:Uncharacterized protein n=1 Tax=Pseudocercospora eumusae TaxID=321146 RepID=A0A139H2E6_9PEZI|nr:hypothetical protein AC578_11133 [Pseudocercospora eumusae]
MVLPLPDEESPSSPSDAHRRVAPGSDPIETDFGIATILERKTKFGLDWYRVKWQPTDVRADQVHEENGVTVVEIDGVRYGEVEEIWRLEGDAGGAGTVTVVWRESWKPVWRLGRALASVAEYYERHPDQDEVRSLAPRFWNWYELNPERLRVQIEAMSWAEVELNGTDFQPEHIDYTKPLMKLCSRLLKQKPQPWVRLLNMPVMRLLRFTDEWIERGHFHIERVANLKAMLVHCVGTEKVDRCTTCADLEVPFPLCVVDDAEFRGACTNCVVLGAGREQRCEWHHGIRLCERNDSRPVEELDDDNTAGDSPTGESQRTPPSDYKMSGGLGDAPGIELAAGEAGRTSPADDSGEVPDMAEDDELYKSPDLPAVRRRLPVLPENTQEAPRSTSVTAGQRPLTKESTGLFVTPDRDAERPKAEASRQASRSESVMALRPASHSQPANKRRDEALGGASTPQPKRQRSSLEPNPPRVGKHTQCGSSFTCLDVEVGCPDAVRGPVLIHADHSFDRGGQASPAEVRFIVGRCNCANAEKLRRAYRDHVAHRKERGMSVEGLSFEKVMSEQFWEALNEAIQLGCPPRPGFGFQSGECIVLDD